jgi:hypothetical protein
MTLIAFCACIWVLTPQTENIVFELRQAVIAYLIIFRVFILATFLKFVLTSDCPTYDRTEKKDVENDAILVFEKNHALLRS